MYDQKEYSWFIRQCRDSIFDNVETSGNPAHGSTAGRNPKKIDAYINKWYLRGLIDEIFNIAWDDFRFQVLNDWGNRYAIHWTQRIRRSYNSTGCSYNSTGCSFRGHTKYVKNTDHEPKSEDPKQAWRQERQLKRDRSNCGSSHMHDVTIKTFFKRQAAREHRRWVRQQLAHDQLDQFHDREYLIFADPWSWD